MPDGRTDGDRTPADSRPSARPPARGLLRPGLIACLSLCLSYPWHTTSGETILHRETSLYRNIIVRENANQRCLVFSTRRSNKSQTCINLKHKKQIVFPYVRMTFAGLLVNPDPGRALMIGLGGGTISGVLMALYPDMYLDIVEIDPAVIRVAREYFNFRESPRTRTHVVDGRVFTRRAVLTGTLQYDLIILDAFTGDYIPEHLMTLEFLTDIKRLLAPGGVLVANTFTGSDLYHHESVTYQAVFGNFFNFKRRGIGNRVIVATKGTLPDRDTLERNAALLAPRLAEYAVRITGFPRHLSTRRDWNKSKRVLTDQFSPVNLLQGK